MSNKGRCVRVLRTGRCASVREHRRTAPPMYAVDEEVRDDKKGGTTAPAGRETRHTATPTSVELFHFYVGIEGTRREP